MTVRAPESVVVTARAPESVLVTSRLASSVTVTARAPEGVTVAALAPSGATVTARGPSSVTMTVRLPSSAVGDWPTLPDPAPNLVLIVADDLGLPSLSVYDGENAWPTNYGGTGGGEGLGYADLPWLSALVANGVRFTEARTSARCTPTRAQLQTGRYGFDHTGGESGSTFPDADPHAGTGLGDIQNGVQASYRTSLRLADYPLGRVIRESGSDYQTAGFGKWHLNDEDRELGAGPFIDPAQEDALDPESEDAYAYWSGPVRDGGYDWWHSSTLFTNGPPDRAAGETENWGSGTGDSGRGYFEHYAWEFSRASDGSAVPEAFYEYSEGDGQFVETSTLEGIERWLNTLDTSRPFFLQYHAHCPHSVLGALPPASGPGGATIHTTFTEVQLVPGAVTTDGKVLASDPSGGYDSDGVFGSGSPTWPEDYRYTTEGAVSLLWRRHIAYIEALDYYCDLLESKISSVLGAGALQRTLFIFVGDNGASGPDFTPLADRFLTSASYSVLPPTSDDSEGGDPYHDPAHMKGGSYEGGTRVPLVAGGVSGNTVIQASSKGDASSQYVDMVDLYGTIMDIVQPGWASTLGTSISELDTVSILPILASDDAAAAATGRSSSFAELFGPPDATTNPNAEWKIDAALVNSDKWKLREHFVTSDADQLAILGLGPGAAVARVWELYNLNTDADEQTDLFTYATTDPAGSAALAQLRALTAEFFELRYPDRVAPIYPTPL
jgi:arylsulfatase A-like enzyme